MTSDSRPADDGDPDAPASAASSSGQRVDLGRRSSPDRVLAFTDGVFAIIITILVLEVGVPSNLSEQSLREALDETGATLVAWVISFLLVGMYWVSHRDMFARVTAVNRDVVWLNLLFLLPVSLIPFASAVLGEYHDEPIALHLYGAVLITTSVARVLLYAYISRRPALLSEPISWRARRLGLLLAAAPIVLYLLAMILGEPLPRISLAIYLLVPGAYFVLVTVLRDRPATAADADGIS